MSVCSQDNGRKKIAWETIIFWSDTKSCGGCRNNFSLLHIVLCCGLASLPQFDRAAVVQRARQAVILYSKNKHVHTSAQHCKKRATDSVQLWRSTGRTIAALFISWGEKQRWRCSYFLTSSRTSQPVHAGSSDQSLKVIQGVTAKKGEQIHFLFSSSFFWNYNCNHIFVGWVGFMHFGHKTCKIQILTRCQHLPRPDKVLWNKDSADVKNTLRINVIEDWIVGFGGGICCMHDLLVVGSYHIIESFKLREKRAGLCCSDWSVERGGRGEAKQKAFIYPKLTLCSETSCTSLYGKCSKSLLFSLIVPKGS